MNEHKNKPSKYKGWDLIALGQANREGGRIRLDKLDQYPWGLKWKKVTIITLFHLEISAYLQMYLSMYVRTVCMYVKQKKSGQVHL